jgi:hypothetical protein
MHESMNIKCKLYLLHNINNISSVSVRHWNVRVALQSAFDVLSDHIRIEGITASRLLQKTTFIPLVLNLLIPVLEEQYVDFSAERHKRRLFH